MNLPGVPHMERLPGAKFRSLQKFCAALVRRISIAAAVTYQVESTVWRESTRRPIGSGKRRQRSVASLANGSRITAICPGKDSIEQVAVIKTSRADVKRPITGQ
ncbi:hypothetical protein Trydic_g2315 [Trypoxylus dichotomus]